MSPTTICGSAGAAVFPEKLNMSGQGVRVGWPYDSLALIPDVKMAIWSKGLQRVFLVNGLASVLLTACVAGIGVWAATSLSKAIETSHTASTALRHHMAAD